MIWTFILCGLAIFFSNDIVQSGLSTEGIDYSSDKMVTYSVNNIATGIFEEVTFRLLLFLTILKYQPRGSVWKISCYTSIAFALSHFTSFFKDTVPLSVVVQIIFAFGVGLLLQAILVRSGNVILVIILHACINQAGAYESYFSLSNNDSSSSYTFSHFILNVLFFLSITFLFILPICWVLLRKNRLYGSVSLE
jgi:membrane protease YdiL (CAAX protease family)